jgi:hypothetical protein
LDIGVYVLILRGHIGTGWEYFKKKCLVCHGGVVYVVVLSLPTWILEFIFYFCEVMYIGTLWKCFKRNVHFAMVAWSSGIVSASRDWRLLANPYRKCIGW